VKKLAALAILGGAALVLFAAVSLNNLHTQGDVDDGVTETCGLEPSRLCEYVLDATGSPLAAQIVDWTVTKPLEILLIIVIAIAATVFVHRLIRRVKVAMIANSERLQAARHPAGEEAHQLNMSDALRSTSRADTLSALLRSIASSVIFIIAGVMILAELGVAVGPLIAGAGILGVALGFGSQKLVADFLSGVFMIMEDQYGVGDTIDTGFCIGQVEGVGLRTTRVRDAEGILWHIPNGQIERIGNLSQEWARAQLDLDMAYSTDLDTAREAIEDCFVSIWEDPEWRPALIEEPEILGIQNFGVQGITMRVTVKTQPAEQWRVGRELRRRLKEAFDARGIEMPSPPGAGWVQREQPASRDSTLDADSGT
jgi:small conductance mechanosensitive channel